MTTVYGGEKARHFLRDPRAGLCFYTERGSVSLTGEVEVLRRTLAARILLAGRLPPVLPARSLRSAILSAALYRPARQRLDRRLFPRFPMGTIKPARPLTPEEVLARIERYCAYQDRCLREVRAKLQQYSLSPSQQQAILTPPDRGRLRRSSPLCTIFRPGQAPPQTMGTPAHRARTPRPGYSRGAHRLGPRRDRTPGIRPELRAPLPPARRSRRRAVFHCTSGQSVPVSARPGATIRQTSGRP